MSIVQRAQQFIESTPAPVNWSVMLGSLLVSILQPAALAITLVWGCLQAHGYVKREFNRDFLWLSRLFGKKK